MALTSDLDAHWVKKMASTIVTNTVSASIWTMVSYAKKLLHLAMCTPFSCFQDLLDLAGFESLIHEN
jgi:hypothetical protein